MAAMKWRPFFLGLNVLGQVCTIYNIGENTPFLSSWLITMAL